MWFSNCGVQHISIFSVPNDITENLTLVKKSWNWLKTFLFHKIITKSRNYKVLAFYFKSKQFALNLRKLERTPKKGLKFCVPLCDRWHVLCMARNRKTVYKSSVALEACPWDDSLKICDKEYRYSQFDTTQARSTVSTLNKTGAPFLLSHQVLERNRGFTHSMLLEI